MQPGYQQYPPFQPPLKKKRAKWPWVLAGIGVFFLLLCGVLGLVTLSAVGNEVDKQIQHGSTEKRADVTLNKCYRNSIGFVQADFTVVNNSDRVQSYWIQFEVRDDKNVRLGEMHGVLNNVGAGATAKETAVSGIESTGKYTCVVVRVD